ncbi:insulin-like peptide receptor isoform X2 [Anoplophora glabripennis]|uniref:insulin-like peptide receptor isoform X2 n=1 Tax=Anoplophora glabripennis TaxID=217634 RepID=UPI0008735187|nr:insulin-like peptide receptor isoform X2 [Anoplophora glabripennis]
MLGYNFFIFLLLFMCVVSVECKTCQSMDIRNEISDLNKLKNCSEIVGYLRIVLMELVQEHEFDNYVFPELTKITGYLFFYDVFHLTSVGKLFPNLMVIRGYELFTDYSLVIYNMPHLREIGTNKLMYIARGFVKVEKCPNLCYANTVNWTKISTRLDFTNINNGTCDACSRACDGQCWNSDQCQMKVDDKCHRECLGCSEINSDKHCWVCKNYNDHGTCVAACPRTGPQKKYRQVASFKCVTENECRTMLNGTWWIYEDQCVNECPLNYEQTVRDNHLTCKYCGNKCTKWCKINNNVDSLDKVQALKGCTHINGSLMIRMSGVTSKSEEVIIRELWEGNLLSVRYISDSLVVALTNSLHSLDFLVNLREIGGKKLERGRFAIFVYENKKLQRLWNFQNSTLKIKNGTLGFFNNPLLCPNEIKTLANLTNIPSNFSQLDVYANGDQSACEYIDLKFTVSVNVVNATLKWDLLQLQNNDVYIGFTVYYTENRKGNISTFNSKIACSEGGWESHFTSNNSIFLVNLKPFTRYAYYIKTYQSSMLSTQTPVHNFTTLPSEPEEPANLEVTAIDDQTLNLTWSKPNRINGILSHYQLYVVEEPDIDIQRERDYCLHSRTEEGDKIDDRDEQIEKEKADSANRNRLIEKCTCLNKNELVTEEEVSFLSMDVHLPICDLQSQSKFGFDHCKHLLYEPLTLIESKSAVISVEKRSKLTHNTVKKARNSYKPIHIDANLTKYKLKKLKHFTMYVLYFSACNEGNMCGPVRQSFARTKKQLNADDISSVTTKVENSNALVEWVEPRRPNGVVVAYNIEYKKVDVEHSKPRIECLSRNKQSTTKRLSLTNLLPGTYAVRVQAISLAGAGQFSKSYTFVIVAPAKNSGWVVPLISILLILALLAFIFYMQYRRKQKLDNIHLIASINPDYDGIVYVEDEWEIDRKDIELQGELGHGTFGMVYCGLIKSKNITCAIKTVNENLSLHECMEFLNEASIMKAFSNSHHVVKLLGVVSRGQPPLVVMELMERGDLKKYLRKTRDSSQNITANEIYRMSIEIADGMSYLTAKKFVHRDLAARNCMVANDRTVKIGDFGMARDIYETDYYRKETKGLLPVRWMAPESLADGVFTSDSDVWSYGIVLWEIATLAEQPYQGLSNEQVLQFVVSKGKLERPSECPDLLYEIMDACWCWRPNDRPTFIDIVERLEDHVGQDFKLVSFVHSREGLEHKMNHGRERSYNPPALGMGAEEHDLYGGHYNVSDEEVSLYVGDSSNRPRFLPASISQRLSRFSPSDIY